LSAETRRRFVSGKLLSDGMLFVGQKSDEFEYYIHCDKPKSAADNKTTWEESDRILPPNVVARLRRILTVQHEVKGRAKPDHMMKSCDRTKEEPCGWY
jgi:hypothetical protein